MTLRTALVGIPLIIVLCVFSFLSLCGPAGAIDRVEFGRSSCGVESKTVSAPPVTKNGVDPYAREVTKKGNRVIVSRKLAEAARQDEKVVLSKAAVRTRVDDKGSLRSYELVQIDKGSVVERLGLKPGDQLTRVNGIPVRDLEQHRAQLENSDRFYVTVLRKGKVVKLDVQIR